jgi:hypothetical protein
MNQFSPEEMGLEESLCFGFPFSDGSQMLFSLEQPYAHTLQSRAAQQHISVPDYIVKLFERAQADPSSPWNLEKYPVPESMKVHGGACQDCGHRSAKSLDKLKPLLACAFSLTLLLGSLYDYIQ